MAIDIPAMMDTLRQIALEEGNTIAEPDVLAFHRAVPWPPRQGKTTTP
jgi:hypothetical protein